VVKKFINRLENIKLSFWQIFFLFYSATFIRTFIEINTTNNNGYPNTFIDTFFHYPFWYFAVFLSVVLIFHLFTKEKISKIFSLVSFSSFFIITPPIIDFIFFQGKPVPYNYLAGTPQEIFKYFLTYLHQANAVGFGIKIEVAIVILFSIYYVFLKTKNIIKSILAGFLIYCAIFLMGSLPVYFVHDFKSSQSIANFYYLQEPKNSITLSRTFLFDFHNYETIAYQKIQNIFSLTISILCLILDLILLSLISFLKNRQKFLAILKNFRISRTLHYLLLVIIGVYFGNHFQSFFLPFKTLFDWLSFFSVVLSVIFAWGFAVWENDEVDINTDSVSNQNRPLVKKLFSKEEWQNIKWFFLFLSLTFALLSGFLIFNLILLSIIIAHLYSCPPLRLKKFFPISSICIGIVALLIILAGNFLVSANQKLNSFPVNYSFGVLIIFMLAENFKDIKDIKGDKLDKIKTIPTIFGEKLSKLIIGLLFFISLILVPIFFYPNIVMFCITIFFGILGFIFINLKKYQEKFIFLTYFLYVLAFVIIISILKK
jgi:4-hydroxybenzoate polyprenyltransferase